MSYDNATSFSWSDFQSVECGDTLKLPHDCFLSMPLRILCVDSTLFVQNRKGDGFIQRFRLPQLTPIGEASISMGNGPQELLNAYRMQAMDSLFGISDLMGGSVMFYPKDSACNASHFPSGRKVRLQELTDEQERLSAELDEKTERWVYLNDLKEKIDAQNSQG